MTDQPEDPGPQSTLPRKKPPEPPSRRLTRLGPAELHAEWKRYREDLQEWWWQRKRREDNEWYSAHPVEFIEVLARAYEDVKKSDHHHLTGDPGKRD